MNPQLLRLFFGILLAVMILLAGRWVKSFLGNQKEDAKTGVAAPTARYVKTRPVRYQNMEVFIESNGRVVSGNAIDLIPEVQGTIATGSVALKEGSAFNKGQLIVKIDDKEAVLNLQASRSQFLTALANILPDIRVDYPNLYSKWLNYYERIDVLATLPTLPALQGAKEKTFMASRGILNQYYSIKSAEERLSKHRLYAPYSGSFSEVFLQAGSVVSPGVKIARIIPNADLEIEIPVKTADIDQIKKGAKIQISGPQGIDTWSGYVSRISNFVDVQTQSLNIYAKINPGQKQIYEGMYMNVRIPIKPLKDVMKIPRNSLFEDDKAFIVTDGQLKTTTLNIKRKGTTEVYFNGVEESAEIVVEPMVNAYEGMVVQLSKEETE